MVTWNGMVAVLPPDPIMLKRRIGHVLHPATPAARPDGGRRPRRLRAISVAVLCSAIALAPLPLGSTEPFIVALWCVWLSLGLIVASTGHLTEPQMVVVLGMGPALVGYGIVLHEQLALAPWFAKPDAVWIKAAAVLGRPLVGSASIVRSEPIYAIGPVLVNGLSLMMGLLVGADRREAHRLHATVALSGLLYAVYGIASAYLDPTAVLWMERQDHFGSVTGTFANKNTASPYFGGVAILWMLRVIDELRAAGGGRPTIVRQLERAFSHRIPWRLVITGLALVICLGTLFMTASRAGVGASCLAIVMILVVVMRRELTSLRTMSIGSAVSVLSLATLLQLFGGATQSRFDRLGFADEDRLPVFSATIAIIRDHPWFGTGIGTFGWAFPAYRPDGMSMWGVWLQAHSTPLELFSEVGIPLGSVIVLSWIGALATLAYGCMVRRRDEAIPMGALGFAVVGLVQSSVDFSMQVPGYTMVVFALVGSGLAQSFRSAKPDVACAIRGDMKC